VEGNESGGIGGAGRLAFQVLWKTAEKLILGDSQPGDEGKGL